MLLEQIKQPSDLTSLDYPQLLVLAEEIREKVIEIVNQNGGHMGPNLGVVELTIALHRAFNSPRDAILWDTGHQSYVHKLLTGRYSQFENLRQGGGMSGYPSKEESEHDWIENSHASTSLSYAHGLAKGFEHSNRHGGIKRRVVAVIGDGALTGGMAFEGLNNLGHSGTDVTIVLNDNGRSYAPTVSRLGESLARLRINPRYLRQQERVEKVIRGLPLVGRQLERAVDATKAAVREVWEPRSFFEDLGVAYTGPFNGHDIQGIETALKNAAKIPKPIVVHVLTEKGRGYPPAEKDEVKHMHDTSTSKAGSYTHAFSQSILKAAEEYPNLVAITAAMPDSTGLLEFAERYENRYLDVGIAEQHALTAASGMAMSGLKPVVALYSTFLTRAFDQLNLDIGLHRQSVVICLDRAGITGDDGPSHHGILDMVLCTKVPGMTVFAPSSYQELEVMMMDAMKIESGPVSIRWPKTAARQVEEMQVGSGLKGRLVKNGLKDNARVAILSVGKMLDTAEQAAELLAKKKIHTTVWDVRCVKPLDEEMLKHAGEHDFIVTVEDGLKDGGAGSNIALALSENPAKIHILGVPDSYIPHNNADQILASLNLDAKGIAKTITKLLA